MRTNLFVVALVAATAAWSVEAAERSPVAAATGPEPTTSDSEAIRFGLSRSDLILSGRFDGTASGGGGATSQVLVNEVLTAPKGFKTPKTVAVYWLSVKDPGAARRSNSFLFFLRPATTNANTGYNDVTAKVHPFVLASDVNVRFLRSQMLKGK